MSKCIKCNRELTSAEIPEFYDGLCSVCFKEKQCSCYPFKQGIYDISNHLAELEHQNKVLERALELACQISIGGTCEIISDTSDWDSEVYNWKEVKGIETYGLGSEEVSAYLIEQAEKELKGE